ncbi:MAG: DnaJ domain-containing protein [Waterburya sp.]
MVIEQYYEVLGLKSSASPQKVKEAYRNLAKTWHPDRFFDNPQLKQQAEVKIKLINQAYEAIKSYCLEPDYTDSVSSSSIKTERTNPEFYYQQGVTNAKLQKFTEAIKDFSHAIRIDSEYIKAYQYRGFIREKLGLQNAAKSDFDMVFKLKLKQYPETSPPQPRSNKSTSTNSSTSSESCSSRFKTSSSPNFRQTTASKSSYQSTPQPTKSELFWECKRTILSHNAGISSIAVDWERNFFASGSHDGQIKLWELNTGQSIATLEEYSNCVNCLCLSSDSKILVSGNVDKQIKLWNLETRKLIGILGDRFSQHLGKVISVAISDDGKTLISNSTDRTTKIWDLTTGKEIYSFLGETIAINSSGNIFANSLNKKLIVRNMNDGKHVYSIVENYPILLQAFSPDSQMIAVVDLEQNINFWNLTTGEKISISIGHTSHVTNLVFSTNASFFASSSLDHTIKLCKIDSKEVLQTLVGHSGGVLSLAISPDAKTIVSGSNDHAIKIWRHR